MKKILLIAAALLFSAAAQAQAQEIAVSNPYAFATHPKAKTGAVFMSIANDGAAPDRLIGVSSDVAEKTELHTMNMDGGIMRMRRVEAYDLPPGEEILLAPMGKHVMLINLKNPLETGETFPLTLDFEQHPDITIEVEVIATGTAKQP